MIAEHVHFVLVALALREQHRLSLHFLGNIVRAMSQAHHLHLLHAERDVGSPALVEKFVEIEVVVARFH